MVAGTRRLTAKGNEEEEEEELRLINLRKKLVKYYTWSTALYGLETCTLRKVDQKYLESFEMWCWRRRERSVGPIVWEMTRYYRVKDEMNILYTIKRRGAYWISHILHRIGHLKHIIEGIIKGDRSDGKTWKKTEAAIGWPSGNKRLPVIETGSSRSQSVKNPLWEILWTCCKTDCGMTITGIIKLRSFRCTV